MLSDWTFLDNSVFSRDLINNIYIGNMYNEKEKKTVRKSADSSFHGSNLLP